MTQKQLQQSIDQLITRTKLDGWTAPLVVFKAALWEYGEPMPQNCQTITDRLELHNFSSFLGGKQTQYCRLYFCPTTYPVSYDGGDGQGTKEMTTAPSGFQKLKQDLAAAASSQSHFPLVSNGSGGCPRTRRFKCGQCINRANTKRNIEATIAQKNRRGLLRESLVVNDQRISRVNGKSLPRRCTSTVSNTTCPFSLIVKWDEAAFFLSLERKSGCAIHQYHTPSLRTSLPTRLLSNDERETLIQLGSACCTNGVGRAFMLKKVGRYISSSKIAYVYSQFNTDTNSSSSSKPGEGSTVHGSAGGSYN